MNVRMERKPPYRITRRVDYTRKEVFFMPGLDRTGPRGEGPMTGGGFGHCHPTYHHPPWWGHGHPAWSHRWSWRRCHGPDRGWGWCGPDPYDEPVYGRYYPGDPSEEIDMLKEEADDLKSALEEINRRIEELEKASEES
jgi:hypothetical protein